MKIIGLILLVITLIFVISYMQSPREVLLDSFEGQITKETVDYGSAEGSSLVVSPDKENKVCGEQSLKIEYDLKPSGYMWIARGYDLDVKGADKWLIEPKDVSWKRYNAISIQIYGQGKGAVVAFDLKDSGGEIWRYILDDDTEGWREVICPIEHFFPRKDWQPEGATVNEIIDYPINSFQFEPRLAGKGLFRIDCVKVVKTK